MTPASVRRFIVELRASGAHVIEIVIGAAMLVLWAPIKYAWRPAVVIAVAAIWLQATAAAAKAGLATGAYADFFIVAAFVWLGSLWLPRARAFLAKGGWGERWWETPRPHREG